MEKRSITLIGAPTSAGAYGPGQEKAPDALRRSGFIEFLRAHEVDVIDKGNVAGFRWEADITNKRAMNVNKVKDIALALSEKVNESLEQNQKIVVIGGDCTIELGSVAGCLKKSDNIGLLYIDLDTDLTTPESVEDGALDWMGVAHLLRVKGTVDDLCSLGPKIPMLRPDQIFFFANGNMTDFEKKIIEDNNIRQTTIDQVASDPVGTAKMICQSWAPQFEQILIHLDTDVLNFIDIPLAENYRRNIGLTLDQLMLSLQEILKAPNWSVLTITEINPDHGAQDGSTLSTFSRRLAQAIGISVAKT
jgi:arginase